jgi:hypothetical protein
LGKLAQLAEIGVHRFCIMTLAEYFVVSLIEVLLYDWKEVTLAWPEVVNIQTVLVRKVE